MNKKAAYALHVTTPGALDRMRSHREPYEASVQSVPIVVLPGVWSPAYDWSGLYYIENLPAVCGLDFLEVGCGTGLISVFAARAGAANVLAVDANPIAVQNATLNFRRFDLKSAQALLSEGFDAVKGRFDVIIFNAPYHGCKPNDLLERGCSDEDYKGLKGFFRDVKDHLKPGGLVSVGFSESGDLFLFNELVANAGFIVKRRLSDWRDGYNCLIFDLLAI